MKNKLFLIAIGLCAGLQSSSILASEKQDISFGPKLGRFSDEKSYARYATPTYARIKIRSGEPIPEGYIIVEKSSDYHPYARAHRTAGASGDIHMGEPRIYQKKLPVSAKHEKWNMWIEGYEPREEFEKRIATRSPYTDLFKNQSRLAKRQELLESPEYQEQQIKEREQLLSLEKQPRPTTQASFSKRLQAAVEAREKNKSYWSRFLNWLSSLKNPKPTIATLQPRYSSEYTTIEDNPRGESVRE